MKSVLAIDLGASSGRMMLGHLALGKILLQEVHRFSEYTYHDGMNLQQIMKEIRFGLQKAATLCNFQSIAIDSWSVDFGLLDTEGQLIGVTDFF